MHCGLRASWLGLIGAALLSSNVAHANPEGMSVARGSATASRAGSQLTVKVSDRAFLDWRSFNIGASETTTFLQPSAASIVWNRINDPNPTQIFGHLDANGIVVLANQSGFYFGPDAMVKAAALAVTTAPISPMDLGGGGPWNFNLTPTAASIVNYGRFEIGQGGSAFLIAEHIENHGEISAPEGQIGLYAGKEVLLSERPDGRGLSAQVRLPDGSVDHSGRLLADAGSIALQARVVNVNGLAQANSIRSRNGVIELVAEESLSLGAAASLEAKGDRDSVSDGGRITLKSEGRFADTPTSQINVAGGTSRGNGGQVEISAPRMQTIRSTVVGPAQTGWRGGTLSIDPLDIFLSNSGDGQAGSGLVDANAAPDALQLNVNSAFVGFSQIHLQAQRGITVGTLWDLNQTTGVNDPGSKLTLEAGRDIRFNNLAGLVAGQNWSLDLSAGVNFSSPATVNAGTGGIYLNGNSSLESQNGSIRLRAGREVIVDSGFIRTIGGGSIDVEAVSGNVICGTKPNGFRFTASGSGYEVDLANLGGISSGAGGDVTIKAGGDVNSYLPTQPGNHTDGGTGAFGGDPGNVTIEASGSVHGHFVVRNGVGSIHAGQDAGAANQLLALSLVKGGWTVEARNIYLQEVRDPNGIFNRFGFSTTPTRHNFDFDPHAFATLNASDSVQLLGVALPRNAGIDEAIRPIYPPSLEIHAGAGGVTLGNQITLFPSPFGDLSITTTAGGPLRTTGENHTFSLVMSDSDRTRYSQASDFGAFDHAATPWHLDDPKPAKLDISGTVRDLLIAVPKRAELRVGGDLINTSFIGQNLRDSDVTSIEVAGNIFNRNDYTFLIVDTPPRFDLFDLAIDPFPPLPDISTLRNRFVYDPQTHRLGFRQRMSDNDLKALLTMQVVTLDSRGNPILNSELQPITHTDALLSESVVRELYNLSRDVPEVAPEGYQLGGPGRFTITARDVDLGITKGIISWGPRLNPALANYSTRGADVQVSLSGDLSMFASSIHSVNGGDITVHAGGLN